MEAQHVIFPEPNRVELQSFTFDLDDLPPDQVAIETRHSIISPGTELACLSGEESWAPLPFVPGYGGCGEVIAVGDDVEDMGVGDTVFSYTKHASVVTSSVLVSPVPPGLNTVKACFARMAAVSITALRVSEVELGDHVAVIGLGLVGNLCAQLFTLAGCEVIGIDPIPERCRIAEACGVRYTVNPAEEDRRAFIEKVTDGHMCETVVEAIGAPAVGARAGELAGPLGEVILLGSPRGECVEDITPLLNSIHLWGDGCITYKGAHEWRYPTERDKSGRVKHSIARNVEILMGLIAEGRLHVEELITHVLPPTECARAYEGLWNNKDEYMGVLFDWTA
ncbi:MAG: zinc-dependent alcohol dehydrogenase [Anaerolineales bacterium]